MKRKIISGILAFIGFILSPFSWWNDLLVNFPISYILAIPFGLINRDLFLAAFITNYWLTNIIGLVLIHFGAKELIKIESEYKLNQKEIIKTLAFTLLYTLLILTLILFGFVEFPTEFLEKI